MQTILKLEDDYFVFNICLIIQRIIQEIGEISSWDISRNLPDLPCWCSGLICGCDNES